MACLNIFISNRMEVLAEQLAETLRSPLSSPLQNEIVIVQNRSMERWISMQIARRLGVCANVRFPFPRAFLYEILAKLTGAAPGDEYEPEIMTWRIMKILPVALFRPSFESLRRYLADDPAGLKRFQLAACIARVFDAYLIFRPEMVAAWERGENGTGEEAWQAELWRMMRTGFDADHIITHREIILQRIRAVSPSPAILPQRVSIFGISTLPMFYLDLFHALSQAMEVNCFFMNPCREFWGDIRSEKEAGRMVQRVRERTGRYGFSGEDLYLEEGNSLLASLG
ncbi:MAG: exodeoxyribonuclease V subunit gamma, partial [Proteobacteria bacterium]|nr:exodeoxyribonuclease V subunit gamma [Pseudomonadota bacterium]